MAEHAGFRPCLRCRPELAPGHAPVDAVGRTARLAAARIEAGALNDDGSLETLARELGLSSRQLRRAIRQEFGVSPVELAQTPPAPPGQAIAHRDGSAADRGRPGQRLRQRPPVQRSVPLSLLA